MRVRGCGVWGEGETSSRKQAVGKFGRESANEGTMVAPAQREVHEHWRRGKDERCSDVLACLGRGEGGVRVEGGGVVGV